MTQIMRSPKPMNRFLVRKLNRCLWGAQRPGQNSHALSDYTDGFVGQI